MHTKPYYIILLAQFCVCLLSAQDQVAKYPVRMCQYYDSYTLLNPALAGSISDYEFSTGHQRLLGNFSKVSAYYFNASMRLSHKQRNGGPFSVVGIRLFNEREGKYINRTRAYLVYSWHANLTRKAKFSAGLEIGALNYNVKGTPLSGDGSDTKPDAAAGVSVYNNDFQVSLSLNQLFRSQVQPLEEITVLYPFINISAERKFKLPDDVVIIPSTSLRILTDNSEVSTDINIGILIKKRLFISPGLHNNNKFVLGLGINDIELLNGKMNFHISYAYPMVRSTINYSIGEIGLVFLL